MRVSAARNLVRQCNAADRTIGKALAVDYYALRGTAILVGNETDQIAVIFIHRPHSWRKRRFAAVAAVVEHEVPAFASVQIVLHKTGEQKPAWL